MIIGRVETDDCTHCHKDLETVHHDVFGGKELVCAGTVTERSLLCMALRCYLLWLR